MQIWAKRLTAMVPAKRRCTEPDANAGGAIDGEGATSGDVQNPDANVSDGNGTNDGTVQNPDIKRRWGKIPTIPIQIQERRAGSEAGRSYAGTNGGVQNIDTNKTEDGGKAEAGEF